MTRYTLSFSDTQGRATNVEELDCASDAEAINALHDRAWGRPAELWRGDDKILSLPGRPRPHHPRVAGPRRHAPSTPLFSGNILLGA